VQVPVTGGGGDPASGALQALPHRRVAPQPSEMEPQETPSAAHVVGTQHIPQSAGHVAQLSLPPQMPLPHRLLRSSESASVSDPKTPQPDTLAAESTMKRRRIEAMMR